MYSVRMKQQQDCLLI